MADEPTVQKMMEIAGYSDITFRRVDAPVLVGRSVEDAINFQLAIGPAGEVFREAAKKPRQSEGKLKLRWRKPSMLRKEKLTGSSWIHRPGLFRARTQAKAPPSLPIDDVPGEPEAHNHCAADGVFGCDDS